MQICGVVADGAFLSLSWFCKTSCALHWAVALLANRRTHAAQSIAVTRDALRQHPAERCGSA